MLCSFGLLQYPPSEKRLVWYLHGVLNSICYRSHFWLKAHVGLLMLLAPLTLVGHQSTATAPTPGFEPAVIRLREAPYPLGQRAQQEGFVKENSLNAMRLLCSPCRLKVHIGLLRQRRPILHRFKSSFCPGLVLKPHVLSGSIDSLPSKPFVLQSIHFD